MESEFETCLVVHPCLEEVLELARYTHRVVLFVVSQCHDMVAVMNIFLP